MRDLIQQMINETLLEYQEKISFLEDEIEDLKRKQRNQIRIGSVVAVNAKTGRVKVSHGGNTTPWVKYFVPESGEVRTQRAPSVNEQTLLLNYGAGENASSYCALTGLFSDQFPPPSELPEDHITVYPNGTKVIMNHATNRMTVDHQGDYVLKTTGNFVMDVGGVIRETATAHIASKR